MKGDNVKSFIDEVLGGGGDYLKLEGNDLILSGGKKEDL